MSNLEVFIGHLGKIDNRNYKIRFAGATCQDNIDWVISLYLYLRHTFTKYSDFDELRVIDPKKISLLGYVSIDLESNTLHSKNGNISNLLKDLNFN